MRKRVNVRSNSLSSFPTLLCQDVAGASQPRDQATCGWEAHTSGSPQIFFRIDCVFISLCSNGVKLKGKISISLHASEDNLVRTLLLNPELRGRVPPQDLCVVWGACTHVFETAK